MSLKRVLLRNGSTVGWSRGPVLNHTAPIWADGAPLRLAWMGTTLFHTLEATFYVHVLVRFFVVKSIMYFHIGNRSIN